MSTNQEFTEALELAHQAYIAEIEQGEAIAKPAFDAATAAYADRALALVSIARLRFNLRNSFFTLALDEYNEAAVLYTTEELADPEPIYQALAKCTVALEVSFCDIADYEEALELFRATGPAGEAMYPDLMEGLLDVAENREAIAVEIADNTRKLLTEIDRSQM